MKALILAGLLLAAPAFAQEQRVDERERTMQMALQLASNAVDGLNAAIKGLTTALENSRQPIIVGQPAQQAQVQQAGPSPLAEACADAVFSVRCGIQALASGVVEAKDLFRTVLGLAPYAAQYGTALKQFEFQKHAATEARLSNADNQQTLQVFGNGLAAVATAPREPGQQFTFNNSQGIAVGEATVHWAPVSNVNSNNPTNPPGKNCFPTYGPTGGITGHVCF